MINFTISDIFSLLQEDFRTILNQNQKPGNKFPDEFFLNAHIELG